jgi:hypothetical protein
MEERFAGGVEVGDSQALAYASGCGEVCICSEYNGFHIKQFNNKSLSERTDCCFSSISTLRTSWLPKPRL